MGQYEDNSDFELDNEIRHIENLQNQTSTRKIDR